MYAITVDGEKYVGRYDRACRVDGGKGDFNKDKGVTLAECQEKCTEDKDCVGYEYNSDDDACEYHRESGLKYLDEDEGAFSDNKNDAIECFWKKSSGNNGDLVEIVDVAIHNAGAVADAVQTAPSQESDDSDSQCRTETNTCGPGIECEYGSCCSQWGWCGTSAAHCGECCQSNCWSS